MISELAYLVIGTERTEEWRSLLEQVVGAMVSVADGGLRAKFDVWQHRMLIVPSTHECLEACGWAVKNAAALKAMRARVAEYTLVEDLTPAERKLRGVAAGFRFADPAGNRQEIIYGRTRDAEHFVSPVKVSRFVMGELGIGHAVLPVGDAFDACVIFWEEALGFNLSDFADRRAPGSDQSRRVHFYHCANARQHSVALAEIDVPQKMLHFLVEVESLDEVGRAIDRCHAQGAFLARTLGRHVNDGMTSVYIDTPGGFHVEFGFGGYQMDWTDHEPFDVPVGSYWGHVWLPKPEAG